MPRRFGATITLVCFTLLILGTTALSSPHLRQFAPEIAPPQHLLLTQPDNPGGALPAPAIPTTFDIANFPVGGGHIIESSPILADIDNDNQIEILVGTTGCADAACSNKGASKRLVVMNPNGSVQWAREPGAPIRSSPSVGDLDNDGDMEIVVSTGGDVADMQHHGAVVAYDHLGNELWRFTTVDHFPKDGYADGNFSSPALCDVDGDGDLEVAFGSWDQRIYLLNHLGQSLWNNLNWSNPPAGYYNADSIWSSPACADLNKDGMLEIIIGADITGGGVLPDGTRTTDGGYLFIFDKEGTVLVRRYVSETIYSSPAVGDLDRDGNLEIVVGTGWYWWQVHGRTEPSYVYAFDTTQVFGPLHYSDPAKLPHLPGWPIATDYPGYSSPALADLDGDNDLEIVIGTGHPDAANDSIPGAGSVYAWHHTGSQMWRISPKNSGGHDTAIRSSPTIADVDNDGTLEILFSMIWDVQVYNANGAFQERLPTLLTIWASPAVGDTDGDNRMEVWIGGGNINDISQGYMWRFENTSTGLGETPWPMFHRDMQHSGKFPLPPGLSVEPGSITLLHESSDPGDATFQLHISNTGDGSFDWTATPPAGVTLGSNSGTVTDQESVQVSVDTSAFTGNTGMFPVGDIQITATAGGEPILDSPTSVSVSLLMAPQIYRVYVPLVVK